MRFKASPILFLSLAFVVGCGGPAGPAGEDGADGATGPAGPAGADGADGTDGTDGTDGANGANGADGTDGTDGADGADGEPCTVNDLGNGLFDVTCGDQTVTLSDPGYTPAEYNDADGIAGGAAYAKWWVTQAGGAGSLATENVTVGAEFVRCKTCHAWDGYGNQISYANRTGQSTGAPARPDVSTVDLRASVMARTPAELFELIRGDGGRPMNELGNGHPDYSAHLSDAQTWNLVKFLREEFIFPDNLYYVAVDGAPVYFEEGFGNVVPTITYYGIGVNGDAANGDTIYGASCASCHGVDGTTIPMGGESVGQLVRSKPYEIWHKVKFGAYSDTSVVQMGSLITSTSDLADLYRALTNETNYPDL